MLTIRDQQMQSLLDDKLKKHLRTAFGDLIRQLSEAELGREVDTACERARSYGIVEPNDLVRFVEHRFCHGAGFDESPGLAPLFARDDLDGKAKMDALDRWDRERQR